MKVVDFKREERLASDLFAALTDTAKELEVEYGSGVDSEVVVVYLFEGGMTLHSLSGDADSANMLLDMAKTTLINSQLVGGMDDTRH